MRPWFIRLRDSFLGSTSTRPGGELHVESLPTDLHSCVEEVRSSMASQAAAKGIALVVNVEAALPRQLVGDPLRIRHCLISLLSHAIELTREGEVELTVAPCGQDASRLWVLFAVRDTGIGIAPGVLDALLETPAQASGVSGLLTVKQSIELMGGRLEASSRLGVGSSFAFELPLQTVAATLDAQVRAAAA